jgi:hypothetical protein
MHPKVTKELSFLIMIMLPLLDAAGLPVNSVGMQKYRRNEMNSEMETATEFALEFVMKITTEVEQLVAKRLAQEIKYRDDAVRRECAERAVAYTRSLDPKILDLWGNAEDLGLRKAIIDRYQH